MARFVAALLVILFMTVANAAPATNAPDENEIRRLIELGRWPRAEAEARVLLERAVAASGSDSHSAADARDLLVAALIANSKTFEPGTRELAARAVELRVKLDGADSLIITESLLNQAKVLKENRQLEEAEKVLQRALAIRERELGPDHLEIARVINELGSVAYRGRDPDLAETRYERASAMLEATVGGDHPECAVSLNGLCSAMLLRRQFSQAEAYQVRSLEIRQRSLGPRHPLTAESMRVLAMVLRRTGDDEKAEGLLRAAVRILEQSFGPEHPQTGNVLNNLALQVRDQGEYSEARGFFEKALAAFESSLDPLDPRIAGVLNNLAAVYRELGDFAEAEVCLRRSLAIREVRYGVDHPAVAQSLGNLANVLIEAARPGEAIPLLERALAIKDRVYGSASVSFAVTLANLGRARRVTGELDRAEQDLVGAIAVFEDQLGADSPEVADQLINLALVEHDREDFDAARNHILRSIDIRETTGNEMHPYVGRAYYNLARVEADAGNSDAAIAAALEAEARVRQQVRTTARGLAEDEAIGYDQHTRNRLDLLLEFSLRWPTSAATAWDALIRSRGLVLNELIARRRAARSDDPRVVTLNAELAAAAEHLARLTLRGAGEAPPESYLAEVTAARSEIDGLERSLGRASAEFRRDQARSRVGFAEVIEALPPGAALVGITRRSIHTDPIGTRTPNTYDYMAMVFSPGGAAPVSVVLGPAPETDALISAWRQAAVAPGIETAGVIGDETAYRRAGEALRRRLWDPLKPLLGRATTVFVVPDGELGLVNLASLPTGAGDYLVESGLLIHMLDEERDLTDAPATDRDSDAVLLALGDPDFDRIGDRAAVSIADTTDSRLRGSMAGCRSLDEVTFSPLPTTRPEIRAVSELWRRHHRRSVQLTGADATEGAFKQLAGGKSVIHLATHGFVLGGACSAAPVVGRGVGGLVSTPRESKEPGRETLDIFGVSGLALAGANHRLEAGPTEEDGVITATEIAYLDLMGLEWAVLSACDTGVGESVSGEGVFGFRRAFRIAGARTVIMSLWPVEDEATQRWMEFLYRARLEDEASTAESVREASLRLLRERREAGRSTHPFYWGAFVAAGDWR